MGDQSQAPDIGTALEHDIEWRKYKQREHSCSPQHSPPEALNQLRRADKETSSQDKSFRKAIDMKLPKQERRVSGLKV